MYKRQGCATTDDVEWLKEELTIFRDKVGGSALVDASPIPRRGDVRLIREASRATKVHVIVGTGLYSEKGRPQKYLTMSETVSYTHLDVYKRQPQDRRYHNRSDGSLFQIGHW